MQDRTGKYEDYIHDDKTEINISPSLETSFMPVGRNSCDNILNDHGKQILQVCKNFDLHILNGGTRGDSMGNFTFHGRL
mgnify:CR=1 FL=1